MFSTSDFFQRNLIHFVELLRLTQNNLSLTLLISLPLYQVLGGPSPTTQSAVRNTTSAHQEQISRDPLPLSIEFENTVQKPSRSSDAYISPSNSKMSSPQAASPAPESTEAHNGALASPTVANLKTIPIR